MGNWKSKIIFPAGWGGGEVLRGEAHILTSGWSGRCMGKRDPHHLGDPCVQSRWLTVPTLCKIAYVTATQYHPWLKPVQICKQPGRTMRKLLIGVCLCFPYKRDWCVEGLVIHLWALEPCVRADPGRASPEDKDQHFNVTEDGFICCNLCCPQFYSRWTIYVKTNEQIKLLGDD